MDGVLQIVVPTISIVISVLVAYTRLKASWERQLRQMYEKDNANNLVHQQLSERIELMKVRNENKELLLNQKIEAVERRLTERIEELVKKIEEIKEMIRELRNE